MYEIKQFFKRIYNLYRWFPVIWKDQDWDDFYIFEILKFKLKNQAKYISNKDRYVDAKRDAEIMRLCIRLIEKVQDEYYSTEYLNYRDSELTFVENKEYPGHYEVIEIKKSEHFDDYFKKYPRIAKQLTTNDKGKKAFKIAQINEERAHKLLFKILEQNIRKWWD